MKSRHILLDTETTGFSVAKGDRIIEICCIELIDGKLSKNIFHVFLNPQRESHPSALKTHGLTSEFLKDKPTFAEIAEAFLAFIRDADLIIHNAPFDLKFLNSELALLNKPKIESVCHKIIDTLVLARNLYPKSFLTKALVNHRLVEDEILVIDARKNYFTDEALINFLSGLPTFSVHSLDKLCKYFRINLSSREKFHGALIDCELLGEIYVCMKAEEKKHLPVYSVASSLNYSLFTNEVVTEKTQVLNVNPVVLPNNIPCT